ncbi:MAG: hypothetical protein QG564_556 [Campylobacterota bacterium]|nr:hypothetical protein [Campylobacterota bacterium]
METVWIWTFILIAIELLEAFLQRANTLGGMLQNLYRYYTKSIFLFFLIHPGFYFVLFVALYSNVLNAGIIFIIAFKVFDIFYKIELIKQIFIQKKVSKEMAAMLEWKIPSWFFLIGACVYPLLLFCALS